MADKTNSNLTTKAPAGSGLPDLTPPKRKQYEYYRSNDPNTNTFNKLGAEGWRLVSEDGRWTIWEREIV